MRLRVRRWGTQLELAVSQRLHGAIRGALKRAAKLGRAQLAAACRGMFRFACFIGISTDGCQTLRFGRFFLAFRL